MEKFEIILTSNHQYSKRKKEAGRKNIMSKGLSYIVLTLNLFLVGVLLLSFRGKNKEQLEELVIKGTKGIIKISVENGLPSIGIYDSQGNKQTLIQENQLMTYGNNNQIASHLGVTDDGTGNIRLADSEQKTRLLMQGGQTPGIFLKNGNNKTVGSWAMLQDGGTGIGLGDGQGRAASVIRGGATPSVSFFNAQSEPMAALGMIQHVPHMLIAGPMGNEGILIHGGKPSSMVVVDEGGKIKILISKHGVFQGKEQQPGGRAKKKENKVFSLEGARELFPEQEMKEVL